MITDDLY